MALAWLCPKPSKNEFVSPSSCSPTQEQFWGFLNPWKGGLGGSMRPLRIRRHNVAKSWWPEFDLWDHDPPHTHTQQTNKGNRKKNGGGIWAVGYNYWVIPLPPNFTELVGKKLELAIAMLNNLLTTIKKGRKKSLGICFSKYAYWGHHEQKYDLCFSIGSWSTKE